jgi:hypothetical protein
MSTTFYRTVSLIILFLALTACGLPTQFTPTPVNFIQTAAAGTVIAQLTAAAPTTGVGAAATATPQAIATEPLATFFPATATATLAPLATNTLSPVNTPPPANTQAPTIPCDRATFVEDITYPDNTEVAIGSTFVKTWRLKNNGTCTWNSSYVVIFDQGDAMLPSGSASSFQLTTSTVAPGQEIDVSLTFKAPDKAGTYQGYWKLRNGGNILFGIGADASKSFWVKVKAVEKTTPTPSASVQFDLITKGKDASWYNASGSLPWGDSDDDSKGIAVDLENTKLNDGKNQARVLATYPQMTTDGVIYGIYPAYTVQDKDHFRASLGFRGACEKGNAKFQVKYREGATEASLGEWIKSCDEKLLDIDLDLAALKGKSVQFVLLVSANGAWEGDRAVWLAPRVEH